MCACVTNHACVGLLYVDFQRFKLLTLPLLIVEELYLFSHSLPSLNKIVDENSLYHVSIWQHIHIWSFCSAENENNFWLAYSRFKGWKTRSKAESTTRLTETWKCWCNQVSMELFWKLRNYQLLIEVWSSWTQNHYSRLWPNHSCNILDTS